MRNILFGLFILNLAAPVVAQTLMINKIEGLGNFDGIDCRDSFICFMTYPKVKMLTHWTPRDANGLSDDEIRSSVRVNFTYRYGVGVSSSGQSGSGGIFGIFAGGTSIKEQQESVLYLRCMVYAPGNKIPFAFQVQAVDGEEYPVYHQAGISTPFFSYQQWGNGNNGSLAQLNGQQRLIAVATTKALIGLIGWWIDPDSAPYGMSSQEHQTSIESIGGQQLEPPLRIDPISKEYGRSASLRTVRKLTLDEWKFHLNHPRAKAQYVVKGGKGWIPTEDLVDLRFDNYQEATFYQQDRRHSSKEFFWLRED